MAKKFTMIHAFNLRDCGDDSILEMWWLVARDMKDDLPPSWTADDLVYVSHVVNDDPDQTVSVTFTTPDFDVDQFLEYYPELIRL